MDEKAGKVAYLLRGYGVIEGGEGLGRTTELWLWLSTRQSKRQSYRRLEKRKHCISEGRKLYLFGMRIGSREWRLCMGHPGSEDGLCIARKYGYER